jgi:hypothetical protein
VLNQKYLRNVMMVVAVLMMGAGIGKMKDRP